jgi:hypothetical protein
MRVRQLRIAIQNELREYNLDIGKTPQNVKEPNASWHSHAKT